MAVIFLSAVTKEFGSYRTLLAEELRRDDLHNHEQKYLIPTGTEALDKLDRYITQSDLVLHIVGDLTGACPPEEEVAVLRDRYPDLAAKFAKVPELVEAINSGTSEISYTQWEALLGYYHGKKLVIATPTTKAKRDCGKFRDADQAASQKRHLEWLKALNRFPQITFASADKLAIRAAIGPIVDILRELKPSHQPNTLPLASLGSLFKGREADLERIEAALESSGGKAAVVSRAIHGMGGIGKTRLAVEYAWAHRDRYSAVLFLPSETPAVLNDNLAALVKAEALDLPEKDAPTDEVRILAALGWLERHPTWLMIIDNVDDKAAHDAVVALWPRLINGHVLITARETNFSGAVKSLDLGLLSEDAAKAYLDERTEGRRKTAADDEAARADLVIELDGLALALEQAGAYIAVQRISYGAYLKIWRETRETALSWFDKGQMTTNHDEGLATTFAASVAKLSAHGKRLLGRLGYFAAEPIPDSILDVPVDGDPEDYRPKGALVELYEYSLAERSKTIDNAFSVHRLVQDYARRSLDEEVRSAALNGVLSWLDAAFRGRPQDVRTWPILEPLATHVGVAAEFGGDAKIAEPTAILMNRLAILHQFKGRFSIAEPLFRKALALGQSVADPYEGNLITYLNNLASLLQATNHFGEAEALMRRALAIHEASHSPGHPNLAIWLNNLASLLQATNRLAEAEPLMRRALAIGKASYGPDHPSVAMQLNNLAQLLQATNRLDEAEPLMTRALAIDEACYGPDHPSVAVQLSNLALLLKDTNRLDEAEPLTRRALAIDEVSYGLDHPTVARDLINLASLLKATNRLSEAEPLMKRALAIGEASYGPDHPHVAIQLNNLASLLQDTNRVSEAEPLMRRVMAICEASHGPDHPHVAIHLNNLASLLRATNRLGEAEPLMRRTLEIFIKFGITNRHQHPHLQAAAMNYYQLLEEIGLSPSEIATAFAGLGIEVPNA